MTQLQKIKTLIENWKLNKTVLAAKTGMNPYTFKMKLLGTYPTYKFTDDEIKKLASVLKELGIDITKATNFK